MKKNKKISVGIIMGSDSDLAVMKKAAEVLQELKIGFEVLVVSAHRTPKAMYEYAQTAAERGIKIIIAGAGGSAHLPGMVASLTHLPVIGVPVETKSLKGIDSLLSIIQMPPGVPVATVAINSSVNAALLAARILGTQDSKVETQVIQYQKKQITKVKQMNLNLNLNLKKPAKSSAKRK